MQNIKFIIDKKIDKITPLLKGWSKDEKYILEDYLGNKYLLRISNEDLYDRKKEQYENLYQIKNLDIFCSKPIEFGKLSDNRVYMVLSYLDGVDAKDAISRLSNKEAYELGLKAGRNLKTIHQIPIPKQEKSWYNSYHDKMKRKIEALNNCQYRLPMQEKIIKDYLDNSNLMVNRPVTLVHGDYHLGNMIIKDGDIGIIDFDKVGIADPYDDLKPYCWNVMVSAYFETGLIDGYFNNNVPVDFFSILKFYTIESLISHLPWAVQFGQEEIDTANKIANYQFNWWDDFNLDIPKWYKKVK